MPFFDEELSKAFWQELNYAIISYKIRVRKIESFMQNKETFVSLFYQKSRRGIRKL